ncbi:MAG: putative Membrane-associated tyrosine- and threonine-specific cdc2-inhibitory kinase [Streblomastix strix]|uniref:Putative Membrane-associated tyrosine-and threonine-specific cdc2-inhibitory kinase n=1 Tax=Streblomastix strix TaxID=222440 RepID=A0A5J4X0B9_9EUKA|nr:MAG: putative Membrane-associated tyrosine- and threonine-specific cdc2-inhibitory kinase [Streblomastix strix]
MEPQFRPLPLPEFAVFDGSQKFISKPFKKPDYIEDRENNLYGIFAPIQSQNRLSEFARKQAERFETVGYIGSGSFGDVYKVRSKIDGKLYAIKWSRKKHRGDADRRASLYELYTFALVGKHPHLVEFVQAWEQDGLMLTQTELCENGNLENYLIYNDKVSEDTVWKILLDMALAAKWLHDQQVIHLDIKPDNIFVMENGDYKLGDFGLSHITDFTSPTSEGDSRYLAAEVLTQAPTTAADIFSIGATIFEVSERVIMPSQGQLWHQLRNCAPHLEGRSQELDHLVHQLLHPNYLKRPSADQILRHPRLQQMMLNRNWPFTPLTHILFRRMTNVMSLFLKRYYELAVQQAQSSLIFQQSNNFNQNQYQNSFYQSRNKDTLQCDINENIDKDKKMDNNLESPQ